jgi:hypothetical protein
MITPILEKLIFEGKAQYKTFVGGFSQKHIMNIPQNRYIIITDLWYTPTFYFSPLGGDKEQQYIDNMITQLTIIGVRGFNRFLFKNSINFNYNTNVLKNNSFAPNNPIHINTFLIHTDGISLTFSNQETILAISNALAPGDVPALTPPSDYGKNGIPGSIPAIDRTITISAYENKFFNENVIAGSNGNNEYSYPVNLNTDLPAALKTEAISFPILNIGYVEILGQPDKMGY